MLHLHRGERADRLADALADVLTVPLADPFVPEIVSVPTRGIERWLAQRLSHRLGAGTGGDDGVCAGIEFPSPARIFDQTVAAATDVDPDTDPWHPGRLVWPLLEVIDECAGESWCVALGNFLGSTDDAARRGDLGRRFAAARKLADLFHAYGTQRPMMVRAWAAGDDSDGAGGRVPEDLHWQPELWRRLRDRVDTPAPAQRLESAVEALRADPSLSPLPTRLSLFGPTRLNQEQVAVIGVLARHRDVHLWLPHPSPALWDRIRELEHDGSTRRRADPSAGAPRHPLLSSLGRDSRELQLALAGAGPAQDHRHELAARPDTLLGRIQAQLRDDEPPVAGRPMVPDSTDRSVQVHSCHGPDRQVEVLREVVLGLLATDPTLEPRDILVMCPDIETFAPLIAASFGLQGDDVSGDAVHPAHRLQVRLADRSLRQINPVLDVVAQLLELADSRFTSSEVLNLAGSPPVRHRFRFDDDQLDRIRGLMERSGIRWGLDAAHRARYALDKFPQNTWSAGLDRILLGVAMSEDDQHWLGTALPLDDVDSGDVDLVGRFAEFVARLGTVLDSMTGRHPPADWVSTLVGALDVLTEVADVDAWQGSQARAELIGTAEAAGERGDRLELTLGDLRAALAGQLRGRPTRANFRTGNLTMCTLAPMRSVPHRVVCLLGLDDGVFPRNAVADGDDILARDPCVGERDPRSEDRQLLLDAILAATEHLVVVHSGADERTNARRPPAVPIGELLDAVTDTVGPDHAVVVRHPLQPFDARNFVPGALIGPSSFSFDPAGLDGARAAAEPRRSPPPFLTGPLTRVGADVVELDDLIRFLEHPARAFLRQRVGIVLSSEEEPDLDGLPVDLDNLQRWSIGDRLLRDRLVGADPTRARQAEWRRGELPPGSLGERLLDEVLSGVEPLVAASAPSRVGDPRAVDVVAVLAGDRRVTGTVAGLYGTDLVSVSYSKLAPKHRVKAWAQLVALSVAAPETTWRAVTIGRGRDRLERSTLGPIEPDAAVRILAELLDLRDRGLCEPLPLVSKASHTYAAHRDRGGSADDAADRAAMDWAGRFGENLEPAHATTWGVACPLTTLLAAPASPDETGAFSHGSGEPHRFGAMATRLWKPLLDHEIRDTP